MVRGLLSDSLCFLVLAPSSHRTLRIRSPLLVLVPVEAAPGLHGTERAVLVVETLVERRNSGGSEACAWSALPPSLPTPSTPHSLVPSCWNTPSWKLHSYPTTQESVGHTPSCATFPSAWLYPPPEVAPATRQ